MENTINTIEATTTKFDTLALMERVIKAETELALARAQATQVKEDLGEVYGAFAKAQATFGQPKKSQTATVTMKSGGRYSYSYATLPDILAATEPSLNANGIAFSQHVLTNNGYMAVISELLHESGQKISHPSMKIKYNENDPQLAASTESYLRRYSASTILGVCASDEDDALSTYDDRYGNVAPKHNQGRQKQPQQQPVQQKPVAQQPVQQKQPVQSVIPAKETAPVQQAPVTQQAPQQPQQPKVEEKPVVEAKKEVAEPKKAEVVEKVMNEQVEKSMRIIENGLTHAESKGATEEQLNGWAERSKDASQHEAIISEILAFCKQSEQANA